MSSGRRHAELSVLEATSAEQSPCLHTVGRAVLNSLFLTHCLRRLLLVFLFSKGQNRLSEGKPLVQDPQLKRQNQNRNPGLSEAQV